MKLSNNLIKGIFKENPVFVQLLGMCPVLGVTSSAENGLGMGVATTFVLMMSNTVVSSIKSIIHPGVRIPCYIVVIASFVTVIELLMEANMPGLYQSLGLFIPLIVVNCIVLGRAEAFASKNGVLDSLIDGFSMGVGFTLALTLLGGVREFLGAGTIFDFRVFPEENGMLLFILAPGAFIVLGYLIAFFNKLKEN